MTKYTDIEISRNQTKTGKPICVILHGWRPIYRYFDTVREARAYAFSKKSLRGAVVQEPCLDLYEGEV